MGPDRVSRQPELQPAVADGEFGCRIRMEAVDLKHHLTASGL